MTAPAQDNQSPNLVYILYRTANMVFPPLDNNGLPMQGQAHQGQQQHGQAQGQAQAQLPQGPMQAQDFQAYMKQERNLRDEAEARQRNSRNEDKERSRAEAQIKRVSPCTGTTPQSVREWIQEIDLTRHYSNQTVYIASQTARDALRRELEFYLNAQPNRDNVPWVQLKTHLQQSFLSPHEADKLRHEVEKVKQGGFDTSAAYMVGGGDNT